MIEVKDPLPDSLPTSHRKSVIHRELKKIKTDELVNQSLVPKARSSYSFLHLMKRDSKPFDFIFCTGADRLGITKELLLNFRDRLTARLRKETSIAWKRQYIRECYVFTEKEWNQYVKQYPLVRSPES